MFNILAKTFMVSSGMDQFTHTEAIKAKDRPPPQPTRYPRARRLFGIL
ncbi:hypothetical protein H2509_10750 [Stappia sp. F7233]|uniref:Uncharacterized protein n=1 Tax=Stappia albiluteola TaxID=2758565 RepID=A0A839ADJ1_9HYPH|nr:hypothetical protein [Stappia albiluteola]MBA5777601.1 hypothetical protein [Stappia albiluteola]